MAGFLACHAPGMLYPLQYLHFAFTHFLSLQFESTSDIPTSFLPLQDPVFPATHGSSSLPALNIDHLFLIALHINYFLEQKNISLIEGFYLCGTRHTDTVHA